MILGYILRIFFYFTRNLLFKKNIWPNFLFGFLFLIKLLWIKVQNSSYKIIFKITLILEKYLLPQSEQFPPPSGFFCFLILDSHSGSIFLILFLKFILTLNWSHNSFNPVPWLQLRGEPPVCSKIVLRLEVLRRT